MLVELLLGVVSTLRLLSTSYRFLAGLHLSCVSGAQHATSSGRARVHGGRRRRRVWFSRRIYFRSSCQCTH